MRITLTASDFAALALGRAVDIRVGPGLTGTTVEVIPGKAFADYDPLGTLVAVEFLAPCTVDVPARQSEPVPA